jgi:hypothetical protein
MQASNDNLTEEVTGLKENVQGETTLKVQALGELERCRQSFEHELAVLKSE